MELDFDGDQLSLALGLPLCTAGGHAIPGSASSTCCRPGASTAEEIFDWHSSGWMMLGSNGGAHVRRSDGTDTLPASLKKVLFETGLELLSDCSGAGCPEETVKRMLASGYQQLGLPSSTRHKVRFLRAGDIEPHCQQILLHKSESDESDLQPECVMGDILARCSEQDKQKMEQYRQDGLATVKSFTSKVARKWAVVREGKKCFKKMAKHMFKPGRVDHTTLVAKCFVHDKLCRVLPEPRPNQTDDAAASCPIRLFVAGVICHHWSAMGERSGWLGASCLVFLQVISELKASDADAGVLECTTEFDETTGLSPILDEFQVVVLRFSPTMLGLPCSRPRVYMLVTRKSRLRWRTSIEDAGCSKVFEDLFGRRLVASGEILVRAPADEVDEHVQEMALRRGLPAMQANGRKWKFDRVLAPGMRHRLKRYRTIAAKHPAFPNVFCNLRQQPGHGPISTTIPALLQSSVIYSFKHNRALLPKEHFEAMGYKMWGERRAAFAEALSATQSEAQMRSLAGNGMHSAAVGAAIMFLLAGTCRVQNLW